MDLSENNNETIINGRKVLISSEEAKAFLDPKKYGSLNLNSKAKKSSGLLGYSDTAEFKEDINLKNKISVRPLLPTDKPPKMLDSELF